MAIQTEIDRINQAKQDLKTSINAKLTDTQITNETIDNYSSFVDKISNNEKFIGVYFNEIDDDGFPVKVKTESLNLLPNNFFRNVNKNNGQYIRTTQIYLNKEITYIGSTCFRESGMLEKLIVNSESVPILSSTNAFQFTPIAEGNGYIYVLDNLVEEYKNAKNWSTYADQIKPISELEV